MKLQERYEKEILPELQKRLGYKNTYQVPRLAKVVVNRGVGEGSSNPKAVEVAATELASITGQKPLITRAQKSIAAFKIRAGDTIGCKVTLRGARMFHFLDKLINLALPRTRDFRGVSEKSFDGRGNYTLGVKEQLIFPEVDYDTVDQVRGMDITIATTTNDNQEARQLLELLGFPFRKGV